jgi:GAF domain-containing protein
VDAQQPTACAHALRTGKPVAVPNIRRSSIFFGQPTLAPLLKAGSRAVLSYPLLGDNQEIVGVLSFHYAKTNPTTGNSASIAQATAWALRHTPPSQETSTATALTS